MAVTWKKLAFEEDVIAKSLLTEQGDIIYASGASTPVALAHGTSGQVLTSGGHGANPSWQSILDGLSKITVGTSAPESPSSGDIWIDTN